MNWSPGKRTAMGIAVSVAGMVMILRSMGRTWWCDCGQPIPWAWDIWSSHASQHLIDPYFFSHVLHGVLFFAVLAWIPRITTPTKWIAATVIEAGWEILENSPIIIHRYREATISLDYYGDSIANSTFDVAACLLGYAIASKVRPRTAVIFFVAIELVMLVTIRDSLMLNIIMLVSPVDAIKQWQSAGV
ncbi:hypothetical protein K227x_48200 [Rubripirellula lacrimiformis]|uniref:DUF2585 family protein n=1 Tax=Rubripirellula lacrimiformis TaxID=1930273 RepID=A0A517NGZ8_9BACT|nr:DUF2585 family protein [Rubripirellula lacrimiformis]QDT06410.1 hypothetical protein K227x_48200 [Rubripirellula lacrimiformis]